MMAATLSSAAGQTIADLRRAVATLQETVDRMTPAATEAVPLASSTPARQLHGAAAMLAGSVLADSAIEHYRGSFHNSAMYMPLVSATLNLGSSLHGMTARESDSHPVRTCAYIGAIAVGALGTGFHVYNVAKRPGGFRWENLFYGAPLGAPTALALSGLSGLAADRLAANGKRGRATLLGLPAGRVVATFTSLGLAGTMGEAGLLHFRGNFQNPAMYLPVTLPGVAAGLLAKAAIAPPGKHTGMATRFWLALTSILGFAGVAFHCYGISRHMGGWKNWRQNLLEGPPVPAPPSFSGLAVAGLAALSLLQRERS